MTVPAWTDACEREAQRVVHASLAEDLGERGDLTSALVMRCRGKDAATMRTAVVAREQGVLAGVRTAGIVASAVGATWEPLLDDGSPLVPGSVVGRLHGPSAGVLAGERTLLNLLGVLCGTATVTRRHVDLVADTRACVCDTRKTLPGLRRLQKFAVACGGGTPHRMGLHDAVLVKDNHLAGLDPAGIADLARRLAPEARSAGAAFIEFEVDGLDQLDALLDLPAGMIDMVLLDNFDTAMLHEAVARRGARAPGLLLEASGGVRLETIASIAATGVDRISVGALTHGVRSLDLGLDGVA
ncbi:MAG: carboxylating nicotinate-nucleotide diphosphorylase [Planctomycetes bacterium]|nr:carboxylating nicotinate-nucleotide diphosphorylase [Planctomycetota bacterium]